MMFVFMYRVARSLSPPPSSLPPPLTSSSHRPPIMARSSPRVSTSRTGLPVAAAATAAAAATGCDRADLPPNPPPSRRVVTDTACAGRARAAATASCTMSTHWVPEMTFMLPPSSGKATAACVSMYMWAWDGVDSRTPRRRCGAAARAAAASTPPCARLVPPTSARSKKEPAAVASAMDRMGGVVGAAYVTATAAAPARAAASVSARTRPMRSPT